MRLIALLLAVILVTGTAVELRASPDTVSAIDDAPDLVMPSEPVPVAVARPDHQPPSQLGALRSPLLGRMHAVTIFRPPR